MCTIGPIRLIALMSLCSLTNQIVCFAHTLKNSGDTSHVGPCLLSFYLSGSVTLNSATWGRGADGWLVGMGRNLMIIYPSTSRSRAEAKRGQRKHRGRKEGSSKLRLAFGPTEQNIGSFT